MKVIVIGNGPGGNAVASKLNDKGFDVEQYSDEAVGFYSRIKLPSALGSVEKLKALCSKTMPDYLQHSSVVAIYKESKSVLLSSGETSTYDKLVLATGSNARKFYTDSGLKNIHTLRTYHDGIQITKSLKDPVVVLGGGLLGLETALAINTLGYKVCVVEGESHILARQLNTEAANIVEEKCKQRKNFDITSGVYASRVDGSENVESITLQDGNVISCNTLIVAAGVIPSTTLAKNCGLTIERAIVVDSRCKTSEPNIYAIGDCAQYNGICPGMMPVALAMANIATLDILGEGIDYIEPKQMPARFVVDDMKILAFGEKNGQCISKRKGDVYEAWYIKDKKVVGVILVGPTVHLPLAKKMLGKEVEDTSIFLDF